MTARIGERDDVPAAGADLRPGGRSLSVPVRVLALIGAAVAVFGLGLLLALLADDASRGGIASSEGIADFLCYFTTLSNLAVALSLGTAALAARSRFGVIVLRPVVQAGVAQYITVTGVIFALVLNGAGKVPLKYLIANSIVHFVVPPLYLAFWVVGIEKGTLARRDLWKWLIFPLAYVAWTLGRGAVIGWYPYPFVDAAALGYAAVAINVAFLAVFFVLFGLATTALDTTIADRRRRRSERSR